MFCLKCTILFYPICRACLGLNPSILVQLSGMVFRLAVLPCLMETAAVSMMMIIMVMVMMMMMHQVTLTSHLLLGLPWTWAAMLGFALAAVSPAVVVSCLLSLQDRGYGVVKVRLHRSLVSHHLITAHAGYPQPGDCCRQHGRCARHLLLHHSPGTHLPHCPGDITCHIMTWL